MGKQEITEECKHVLNYPFFPIDNITGKLHEKTSGSVFQMKFGKLPIRGRQSIYRNQLAQSTDPMTICPEPDNEEEEAEFPFCENVGDLLRLPVKHVEPEGPTEVIQFALFLNLDFAGNISGLAVGNRCDFSNPRQFLMIAGGGAVRDLITDPGPPAPWPAITGTFASGVQTFGPVSCGVPNSDDCVGKISDFTGYVELDFFAETTTRLLGSGTTRVIHSVEPRRRKACQTGSQLMERCNETVALGRLGGSISASAGSEICFGTGLNVLGMQATINIAHSSGNDFIDANWTDDIIVDNTDPLNPISTWQGWTVVNPP